MSDDYSDFDLVSAYVDGEATADERARVEADPALLADAERLRRLRRELGEVEVPSPQRREAAVAAALATFDELEGRGSPAASANVVPLRSRRARWMQGLTAAAAAAVVVVGGIVIASRGDGDGDEDSTADELRDAPAAAPTTTTTTTTTTSGATTQGVDHPTTTASIGITADDTGLSMEMAPPLAEDAGDAQESDAAAPMAAESEQLPVLRSAEELTVFASAMDQQPPPLDDVVEACDDGDAEAVAVYEDERTTRHDVVVATASGGYAAVSVDDCTAVLIAGR